jgi:hypothetical protein
MKHLKKIIVAAVVGFLAFAPPGTLIFIALLLLSLLGKTWFAVGAAATLIAVTIYTVVYRERLLKISFVENLRQRFKK